MTSIVNSAILKLQQHGYQIENEDDVRGYFGRETQQRREDVFTELELTVAEINVLENSVFLDVIIEGLEQISFKVNEGEDFVLTFFLYGGKPPYYFKLLQGISTSNAKTDFVSNDPRVQLRIPKVPFESNGLHRIEVRDSGIRKQMTPYFKLEIKKTSPTTPSQEWFSKLFSIEPTPLIDLNAKGYYHFPEIDVAVITPQFFSTERGFLILYDTLERVYYPYSTSKVDDMLEMIKIKTLVMRDISKESARLLKNKLLKLILNFRKIDHSHVVELNKEEKKEALISLLFPDNDTKVHNDQVPFSNDKKQPSTNEEDSSCDFFGPKVGIKKIAPSPSVELLFAKDTITTQKTEFKSHYLTTYQKLPLLSQHPNFLQVLLKDFPVSIQNHILSFLQKRAHFTQLKVFPLQAHQTPFGKPVVQVPPHVTPNLGTVHLIQTPEYILVASEHRKDYTLNHHPSILNHYLNFPSFVTGIVLKNAVWSGLFSLDLVSLCHIYQNIKLGRNDYTHLCEKVVSDFTQGSLFSIGPTLVNVLIHDASMRFKENVLGRVAQKIFDNYSSVFNGVVIGWSALVAYWEWKKLPISERKWSNLKDRLLFKTIPSVCGIATTIVCEHIGKGFGAVFGNTGEMIGSFVGTILGGFLGSYASSCFLNSRVQTEKIITSCDILGIPVSNRSVENIKKRWKLLLLFIHPDKLNCEVAPLLESFFYGMKDAYDFLLTPEVVSQNVSISGCIEYRP